MFECNNIYKLSFVGCVMERRLGKDDLRSVGESCDSVKRALGIKYSVCNNNGTAVALFRPVDDVRVFVGPYAGSCEAVDTVFKNGDVFGNYASIIRDMSEVEGWRLCAGDRKVGLEWFDGDYEANRVSRRKVKIGMHIDSRSGLSGALMYMFSNMVSKQRILSLLKRTK